MKKNIYFIIIVVAIVTSCISYMIGIKNGEYNVREEQIMNFVDEKSASNDEKPLNTEYKVSYTLANNRLTKKELNEIKNAKKYALDSEEVSQIAFVVAKSLYGNAIYNEMPLKVSLFQNKIWIIEGTQNTYQQGGTVRIVIEKEGGQILLVTHGK